jgi:hypothetical protein
MAMLAASPMELPCWDSAVRGHVRVVLRTPSALAAHHGGDCRVRRGAATGVGRRSPLLIARTGPTSSGLGQSILQHRRVPAVAHELLGQLNDLLEKVVGIHDYMMVVRFQSTPLPSAGRR